MNISDKYEIRLWQDEEYAIYDTERSYDDYLFIGDIVEINAWLSLKEKGFDNL